MNNSKGLAACSHFLLGVNLGHLFCAHGVLRNAGWRTVAFKIQRKMSSLGACLLLDVVGSVVHVSSRLICVWHIPYVLFLQKPLLYRLYMWEGRGTLSESVSWSPVFGKHCLFSRCIAGDTQLPPDDGCAQIRYGRQWTELRGRGRNHSSYFGVLFAVAFTTVARKH